MFTIEQVQHQMLTAEEEKELLTRLPFPADLEDGVMAESLYTISLRYSSLYTISLRYSSLHTVSLRDDEDQSLWTMDILSICKFA